MANFRRKHLQSPRLRQRNIDIFFMRFAHAFIILYVIGLFIGWLANRETLQITAIKIVGANAVDSRKISALANEELNHSLFNYISRKNVLFYPRRAILKNLNEMDERISYSAAEILPGRILHIKIDEYLPSLLWCKENLLQHVPSASSTDECYFADKKGYIFSHAPLYAGNPFLRFDSASSSLRTSTSTIVTGIGDLIMPEDDLADLFVFLGLLKAEGFHPQSIQPLAQNDVSIKTLNKMEIVWSTTSDPQKAIRNLQLVLKSISEKKATHVPSTRIIDLRFGNKVFYQ